MKRKKATRKDKRGGVKREHYNIPDDIDIELARQEFLKFSSKLDANGKAAPITEAHLKNIIRSAVREKWMHCNVKLAFIYSKAVPDYDPETRRLFKFQCNMCKNWFSRQNVDVDHIIGEFEYTSIADSLAWASMILDVGFDDLQLLCKDVCHPIKTLAERNGISIEDAEILQKAIAWENNKKINHKKECLALGATADQASNKVKRRQFYIQHLKNS